MTVTRIKRKFFGNLLKVCTALIPLFLDRKHWSYRQAQTGQGLAQGYASYQTVLLHMGS